MERMSREGMSREGMSRGQNEGHQRHLVAEGSEAMMAVEAVAEVSLMTGCVRCTTHSENTAQHIIPTRSIAQRVPENKRSGERPTALQRMKQQQRQRRHETDGERMNGFTFYATVDSDSIRACMPNVPMLLPASSWSRKGMRAPNLPAHVTHTAADSGGFVATFKWGDYRYTPAEYVTWLRTFGPRWAATMDYCCEPEIVGKTDGIVQERQRRTTQMARLFWREYKREPWAWVPTVQGWNVGDYVRHARELRPLIDEMADYYGSGSDFRVGIGTLCRRASALMIRQVASAVAAELPGIPLHLWGIKLGALQSPVALPPQVVSVDSAAWNGLFGAAREEWRTSGKTQREWSYGVAMPRYLAKVDKALAMPKQQTLLEAIA